MIKRFFTQLFCKHQWLPKGEGLITKAGFFYETWCPKCNKTMAHSCFLKFLILCLLFCNSAQAQAQDSCVNFQTITKRVWCVCLVQVVVEKVSGTIVGTIDVENSSGRLADQLTLVNVTRQVKIFHCLPGDYIIYRSRGIQVSKLFIRKKEL